MMLHQRVFTLTPISGGATTSRVHTAVKIEPGYHGTTVYVKDASRAVGVAQNLVTAGIDAHVQRFEADHDDYHSIMLKALGERLHEKVRKEHWGYANDEALDNRALIKEQYNGIRPTPACPDHTEKALLWELIDPVTNADISITEHFAILPTAAVSGWYFSHPESKHFGVGKINRDQVEDYARRKGMTLEEAERWLAPNLGYDPDQERKTA